MLPLLYRWFLLSCILLMVLSDGGPYCLRTSEEQAPTKVQDCYDLVDAIQEQWEAFPQRRNFTQHPNMFQDFKVPYTWNEERKGRRGCEVFINVCDRRVRVVTDLLRISLVARAIVNECIGKATPQIGYGYLGRRSGITVEVGAIGDPSYGCDHTRNFQVLATD